MLTNEGRGKTAKMKHHSKPLATLLSNTARKKTGLSPLQGSIRCVISVAQLEITAPDKWR